MNAECHYAEGRYAEYSDTECRSAECHYTEWCYAECSYVECRGTKYQPQYFFDVNTVFGKLSRLRSLFF